jgi:hypothetical protein
MAAKKTTTRALKQKSIGYENIAGWIRKNESVVDAHIQDYFSKRVEDEAKNVWQGQHFEWFANRVERFRFTEVDLAAIGALSVDISAQTVRELIEDRGGVLRQLLRECELWIAAHGSDLSDSELSTDWLKKESCFQRLWFELVRSERIDLGPVKASKLMATKYPGLIPIFDSEVSWLLQPRVESTWWEPMRNLLLEVSPILKKSNVKRDDIYVTPLRKLDVVLWMEAKKRRG